MSARDWWDDRTPVRLADYIDPAWSLHDLRAREARAVQDPWRRRELEANQAAIRARAKRRIVRALGVVIRVSSEDLLKLYKVALELEALRARRGR